MGMIYLSKKVKRSPIVGTTYWADRGMFDFMPSVAYDVPIEGGTPSEQAIEELRTVIHDVESIRSPGEHIGVHIEVYSNYLTITIGAFAS